jgi:2'-5' RNA ligase
MSLEETQRLFIGVPVSESTRLVLARQIPSNLPGNPSPLENWHFTLRFLGATDPERREKLIENLRATNFGAAFDIAFESLGEFPNPRRARVVWMGVGRGKERLEAVAEKAEKAAVLSGFDPESRRFSAHLTVSRIKQPQSIDQFLLKSRKVDAAMRVEEVILYRSEMGRGHSKYSIVARFPLKP